MKLKNSFFYTIREDISDEESVSGNLLVRAGYFKKVQNGIYLKLPLGIKVKENVEKIIRKHMDKVASEVVMPSLIPMEIFEKSGRANNFGKDMFKLNDRYDRTYALGPTDEEIFVETAKSKVNSYKDVNFTLYQIGTKFRDEIRPRLGLIRTREFTMKDAYSFDKDMESLDKTYEKIYKAYIDIFDELGLNYRIVKADTGVMGGLLSEEFQALSDIGEDITVICDNCSFASNLEVCECTQKENKDQEEKRNKQEVLTKDLKTIEEVSNYLQKPLDKMIKAVMLNVDGTLVACFINGTRQLNETKLQKLLNANEIELADDELIKKSNITPGFIGPFGLSCKTIIDREILNGTNYVTGANKKDYHLIDVNIEDFNYDEVADIVNVEQTDICPNCKKGHLSFNKSIEIGNTFKLGDKYSKALNLEYLDQNNKKVPVQMGCYGIGIERTIASIVEQNNDENGIAWPVNIAPYKIAIVVIDTKSNKQLEIANNLYDALTKLELDPILDDRDQRPGVKFKDMDLIGIPYRVVIGKKAENENKVEFKKRDQKDSIELELDDVISYVSEIIK